jgi:beta-glucanase (GH16 family)
VILRCAAIVGLAAGLSLSGVGASDTGSTRETARGAANRSYDDARWRLMWSDEFDRDGAPDPAKWTYERGRVRNKEEQFYTVDRRENARVERGALILTARRESYEGATCTSASMTTEGKFAFTYGKVEVRAKIPTGRGTWPAIWMLGSNRRQVGWPRCGEIDIMENVGFEPDRLHFTAHTKAFNHTRKTGVGRALAVAQPYADFHRYGIVWTPQKIEWFFDGRKVHEFGNDGNGPDHWPFDAPQYLLLNLAIGGAWGGQRGIDETIFPVEYRIDYVRVWEQP